MPYPTKDNPTGAAKKPAVSSQLPEGGFLATLQTMCKGVALADLEANMRELVSHVRRTAKPGSLRFTIKVSPNSKGNVEVLALDYDITPKLPKSDGGTTIYYADDENRLLRNDPRQLEMPALAEVPSEDAAPVRRVATS